MKAGVASFAGAVSLLILHQMGSSLSLMIVVYVIWGLSIGLLPMPKNGRTQLLLVALLLRVILLFVPPIFSDDVYRYVWEGSLFQSGGNPYLTAPSEFSPANKAVHGQINHPAITSIYPPLSMWFFSLVTYFSSTVGMMKGAMMVADLGIIVVFCDVLKNRGKGLHVAWIYALHPLPIIEFSGSGHMDAIGILALLLAIRSHERQENSAAWLLVGGGLKLLPFALLPKVWSPKDGWMWVAILVLVFSALPFVFDLNSLTQALRLYAQHWSFNGSIYALINPLFLTWTRPLLLIVGALVVAYGYWRRLSLAQLTLWVCGAGVLLSPTVHPWYILWAWVPALLCGVRSWTALASLVPLVYVALLTLDPHTGDWNPPAWPSVLSYGVFGAYVLWEYRNKTEKEHRNA